MTVTRDVIYDLLPSYFAGDASSDTRALIDEFFATDPEFGRMAQRFRSLMAERPSSASIDADRAKVVFDRARARAKLRLAATIWGLGALFPFGVAAVTGVGGQALRHPGIIISLVFGAMALATWLTSLSPRPEAWYAAFTGEEKGSGSGA
jgi:hypothetical protein